jgi:hypothetical protein
MHRPESAIAPFGERSQTGDPITSQRRNRQQECGAAPNGDEDAAPQRGDDERLGVAPRDSNHERSIALGFEQLGGSMLQEAEARTRFHMPTVLRVCDRCLSRDAVYGAVRCGRLPRVNGAGPSGAGTVPNLHGGGLCAAALPP